MKKFFILLLRKINNKINNIETLIKNKLIRFLPNIFFGKILNLKRLLVFLIPLFLLFLSLSLPYLRVLSSPYEDIRKNCLILNNKDELKVIFVEAGQGDSIIIKAKDDYILIDSGTPDSFKRIDAFLSSMNCHEISYHIVTHPHIDHNGSSLKLSKKYRIKKLIITEPDSSIEELCRSDSEKQVEYMKNILKYRLNGTSDDKESLEENNSYLNNIKLMDYAEEVLFNESTNEIDLGEIKLKFLSSSSSVRRTDVNDLSACILLTYKNFKMLLTGDASSTIENELLRNFEDELSGITVFKAGHHGSSTSNSETFLEKIQPFYSIITCGLNNPFKHPSNKALINLKKYSNSLYRTDRDGSVIITSDGLNLSCNEDEN